MNNKTEEFIHFEICIERLGSAWNILKSIKQDVNNPLKGPAFRFALVEYAIPFNISKGEIRKNHRLPESYVPVEFLQLHRRLLTSRNQTHAHADLTVLNVKISLSGYKGERLVTRMEKNITGLEEMSNIDEIMSLIKGTMDNMLDERNRLKLALDENST